jgi:hypothetical protein
MTFRIDLESLPAANLPQIPLFWTLADQLEAFGGEANAPFWLDGSIVDNDIYCLHCCEQALESALKKQGEGADLFIGGGYSGESDSCVHCATCGIVLEYTLTDAGAAAELTHFLDDHPLQDEITPDDAYHIARILWAYQDENEEVLELGRKAVALIGDRTSSEAARWENEGGHVH